MCKSILAKMWFSLRVRKNSRITRDGRITSIASYIHTQEITQPLRSAVPPPYRKKRTDSPGLMYPQRNNPSRRGRFEGREPKAQEVLCLCRVAAFQDWQERRKGVPQRFCAPNRALVVHSRCA